MFQIQNVTFSESTQTNEHKSNTPIQVLIALSVTKHAVVDTYHKLYFIICILLYFIVCVCSLMKWTYQNAQYEKHKIKKNIDMTVNFRKSNNNSPILVNCY